MSNKIIIKTRGETASFLAEVSKDMNSINFYCNNCNSSKPVASILDSTDNCFLFFNRTEDGFELKRKSYPTSTWSYNNGAYQIQPYAFADQTEIAMPNGKIFIFRNDDYNDIDTNGMTVGFWDGKSTRLFIRCHINQGTLLIDFAE